MVMVDQMMSEAMERGGTGRMHVDNGARQIVMIDDVDIV
jgi:hypothetical protein